MLEMSGDTCILRDMQYFPPVTVMLFLAGASFGARAPIDPISNDPYTGAIVVDVSTGMTLYEDGADKRVYPASVVKLMDLLLILERVERGELSLTSSVKVTADAARMGGSQVYLKEGESFSLDEMLFALTIKSANDVAVAIAVHASGSTDAFVELMNRRAAELGMEATQFASVHGLPPETGQKPDVTTARDIARLAMEVSKHPKAVEYTSTRERWFRNDTFQMLSHNPLLGSVAGCDGLKTGYYRAAGFSIAATAKRGGRRVIAVVMGCASRPVRDAKAEELIELGFLKPPELSTAVRDVSVPEVKRPPPATIAQVPVAKPAVLQQPEAPAPKPSRSLMPKVLVALLILAVAAGAVLLLYAAKRRRERWKYRM